MFYYRDTKKELQILNEKITGIALLIIEMQYVLSFTIIRVPDYAILITQNKRN